MTDKTHEPSIWDAEAFFLSANACPSCGPAPIIDGAAGAAVLAAFGAWLRKTFRESKDTGAASAGAQTANPGH